MKLLNHNSKGDYLSSKLMSFLALVFVVAIGSSVQAQCPQLAGQTTYSRVINDALSNPQDFLQADYDQANDEVYVSTTYTAAGTNDPFLCKVKGNSVINWAYRYPFTGNDITMAVKKAADGDEIIAGSTVNSMGNHVLFLERLGPSGNFKWARYFDQNNTDLNSFVVLAESKIRRDIIVASSANSLANHIVLIRLDSLGNQLYYDDHPIYAAGNLVEHYPTINAITPTFDDGYVVVGHTGHNWDFFAATVMKYDQKYNVTLTHAMNWWYIYRHPLATYDLWTPGDRSSTFARGVCENPSNKNIIVVGRQGDNDQYGTSTTYQNGFIIVLKPSGALISLENYIPANGDFITFNGVNMAGSDYIITGSDQDPSSGNYKTLITKVSSTSLNPAWAYTYGTNSLNVGMSVFSTANGYISVGISNDNSAPNQPHLLAVDANGKVGNCYTALSIPAHPDNNDMPTFTIDQPTGAQPVAVKIKTDSLCESMYHLCGPICPQLSPKTHYSRVINDNFNTNYFLQADYNTTNDSIYVPSTYTTSSSLSEAFWSNVELNSTIYSSNKYVITGNENALAIKKAANGDVLLAGRTLNSAGNHVLFVMRTQASGVPIWYKYFDQNTTDLNSYVVLTETAIRHDVVVASSSNSLANNIVLLRVAGSTGALLYYDDHPIFAAGNGVEHYPVIRGITPTHDDGYVVVGNTGHNWDFYAATIFKYDAYYNSSLTHAMNWWYIYRHQLPTYDLWVPGERSCTFANAVIEEPVSGHLVVAGYRADHDQYGTNATYQYGWMLQLDSSGFFINSKSYVNGYSYFMSLNGITIDNSGNYVLTGSLKDSGTGTYQTLIMKVFSSNLNPSWAELYGSNGVNAGYSIFTTPNGFLSVGISNDNTVTPQPHLLSVDSLGHAGQCYTNVQTDFVLDHNDMPTFATGTVTSANDDSMQVIDSSICEAMVDLCSSAQAPFQTNIFDRTYPAGNEVSVYPNPANDKLNMDMMLKQSSGGRIVVRDLLGKQVMASTVQMKEGNNHLEINVSTLKPGIYFIQIVSDNNTLNSVSRIQKY